MRHRAPRGFTLIELLVVIAIIAILVSLLLPAVQQVREAARATECRDHLMNLGVAIHNYESSNRVMPPTASIAMVGSINTNASWSIHGRILPYLEQGNVYNQADLSIAWDDQAVLSGLKIPVYGCPSDVNSDTPRDVSPKLASPLYPTSYGFNFGTWLVFDPATGRPGDGAFGPNANFGMRNYVDGTSNTLMVTEVRARQFYGRNEGVNGTNEIPAPSNAAAFSKIPTSIAWCNPNGHTEWPDGRVHHEGITTAAGPNAKIPIASTLNNCPAGVDIDYTSQQEGTSATAATYAVITARSHHPGNVIATMMDGSVRSVSENLSLVVWRAIGTRDGGEVEQLR